MRADLDTLVIALYCAACSLFPSERTPRRGRPQLISDNELLCLMVAQMLLRSARATGVFLAVAPADGSATSFRSCRRQSRYNERCRQLAPKLVLLWQAIACELLGAHDCAQLLDTTPLPCGQSSDDRQRLQLAPWCGFGYCPAHSRRYWGFELVLLVRPRRHASATSTSSPPTRPNARPRSRCSSANPIAGRSRSSATKASPAPSSKQPSANSTRSLLRPSRADEPDRPNPPIGWIRQRIESIVNTLKDQLRLEHHLASTPAGLLARSPPASSPSAPASTSTQLGQPRRALAPYTALTDQPSRGGVEGRTDQRRRSRFP